MILFKSTQIFVLSIFIYMIFSLIMAPGEPYRERFTTDPTSQLRGG